MTKLILFFAFLVFQFTSIGTENTRLEMPAISMDEKHWVDSVFGSLTTDQKIGQLFMIRAHSDKGPEHIAEVERQIKQFYVGGLCFFQGTPLKQAELTNNYQAMSSVPLMIAIDAEWGLGMRHKEAAISFPKAITLGAIKDNKLIYDMGAEIAKQLLRIGTHVNFAPVVDVNVNPNNPVINDRSFGENKGNVTSKAYQYMMGMQDNGVMACAKHFPGHGDTDIDSHHDLPVVTHSKSRMDSVELFPFRLLFEQGMQSVMISHLQVPSIEPDEKIPASLSAATMTDLISKELGYNGLIFSDALEMKAVTKNYNAGDLEAVAFKAGCDILCLPNDISLSFQKIKDLISSEPEAAKKLDLTVKQILHAKYKLGLNKYVPAPLSNLIAEVNNNKAKALKSKLYEQALTLVKNKNNLIPITDLDQKRIGSLSIGATEKTPLQWRMDSYTKVQHFQSEAIISEAKSKELFNSLKDKYAVVVGIHNPSRNPALNFGIQESAVQLIQKLAGQTKVIVVSFANPYALKNFASSEWILQAYEDDAMMQDLAAQAIFGAIGISGTLPISVSKEIKYGDGITTKSLMRFGYSIPERVNINSLKLSTLDAITQQIVDEHAAPGGQLLVAKEGKIIYHKAFGYFDYNKRNPVSLSDIYDLASITKVAASTLSVMKMYEEGMVSLDAPMAEFLPDLKQSNKSSITLTEAMSHQSGLMSWIPFYKETLIKVKKRQYKPDPKYYSSKASGNFNVPVAHGMFLKNGYDQLIWSSILNSEMRTSKRYLYSDLGFYLVAHMIQHQTGQRIDNYLTKKFYGPLGLSATLYNPYKRLPITVIAPTEDDHYWRNTKIQGYVHDMGAAMMDGVSGHAGLFSNAYELGTIMQMLLNGGEFGGKKFLNKSTIDHFTTRQLGSTRRALGFDMKELDPAKPQPAGVLASPNTFGHTGFTGTATWVDPNHQLVFVFLCNRTYPSMSNNRLHKREFRSRLLDAVYLAMEDNNYTEPVYIENPEN